MVDHPDEPAPLPATLGAFAGCSLIWGSTFLFISIGNDTVAPVWAATLRLVVAAVVLNALALLGRQPLPRGRALRAAALFGFFQFGVNFPLLYWGEQWVPSALSAVLFATLPLSSALVARAFRLETLDPLKIGGALVALAGVATIFSGQVTAQLRAAPLLAVFAASLAACLGTVLLKRGPRQSPIGANAVGAGVGLLACFALSTALGEPHALPRGAGGIGSVLYLALASSVVAFVLMAWLIHHWPVTRISFVSVVAPVVAMMLGAAVRHERLTPPMLGGSALVLLGLLIGIESDRRKSPRRA
jgi:drug/metabolite transporter (DMT)-like permease